MLLNRDIRDSIKEIRNQSEMEFNTFECERRYSEERVDFNDDEYYNDNDYYDLY
jgi:hypothetical protein